VRRLRAWLMRLVGTVARARSERDFATEIESHLQLHVDDNIRSGMTPDEARRRALIALGGIEQTKEAHRDRRGVPMIETLIRDLRHAARGLIKTPSFTLAAIVILGLGIGVNTAIFTVVNAIVLRPLPFPDADRIMRVWHTPPPLFAGQSIFPLSPANFLDWQAQNQVFERMAIYRGTRRTITGRGEPDTVIGGRISSDVFPILGIAPILGHAFTADDDRAGGPPSVILSESTWRTRFGAEPSIVGQTVMLDGTPHTVIGVAPNVTAFVDRIQVWIPLAWTANERAIRDNHNYASIAKLKPGIDVARARADLTTIAKRLEQQYPAENKDWGALVRPLRDDLIGDVRTSLLVLFGAVGLVLLIACANLANLLLVRTHARAKEIAVRTALGASRGRVVQQLLTEGALLGLGGGIAGFLASFYGVRILVAVFGEQLPRITEVTPDGRVLAFTAGMAVLTGLCASAAPAWQLTRRDANEVLKQGPGRGNSSGGDGRVRNLLVVSEVALALMLLIGAGLLMRSLATLRAVEPGFDGRNLLTAGVTIPEAKYSTPEARSQFFDRVVQGIRALPGVESAASVDTLPLSGGSAQPVAIEGAPALPQAEQPVVAVRVSSPRYFHTARIPLVIGRDFEDGDTRDRRLVAIVSELAAKRFWPNQSPIGRHLTLGLLSNEPREIVGVVGDIKTEDLDEREASPAVYLPSGQQGFNNMALVVRSSVPPDTISRTVIGAVHAVDPEQPVLNVLSMETLIERSLGQRRFALQLLATFAALALTLATVGIYSVLAYTVRQRVREIGIRMALGAPSTAVLRLVIIEGFKPTLIGVAVGLVLASLLVSVMKSLLFGVSMHDPGTFAAVAAIVVLVGIVATLVPAYRAIRVDPVVTLRAE
jgi:putative ABC transport system permease protein